MGSAVTTPPRIEDFYEEHRVYVLKVLSRRCGWMEPDEREEVFQEAYLVLLERQRDDRLDLEEMAPAQIRAFLTQTAIHKALDEGKRAGRSRSVPLENAEMTVADEARAPEDLASAGLEGARVREIVGDLSERKRAIVKLRFYFERSPDEIQEFLGISERVYRRELERAMRQIQDGYSLVRDGSFCDSRRSGIIALISGISGPGRAQAAREHLATCPSCSAWAAQMRDAARTVGAFVPMPDLLLRHGPLERLWGVVEGLRDGASGASAGAKHQVTAIASRFDQASAGAFGGARPGAAVALVASCLAVGGGATYCAVSGIPEPLAGAADAIAGNDSGKPPKHEQPDPEPTPTPVSEEPVATPPAEVAPPPVVHQKPEKKSRRGGDSGSAGSSKAKHGGKPSPEFEPVEESSEPAPESEPLPEEEFSFEESSAPTPAPAPAPAPSSPPPSGGEFGP